jgi:diguanylate cyclase (GGDEF)-like protein
VKVLVADDDRFSRLILCRKLRSWGHEVEEASDGVAAARALSRPGGPQLGLVDWMMPGLSGPEVCERVRAANSEPYRYLMLLTSRGRREDLLMGLNSGADEYLRKPVDLLELQARLRTGARLLDLQSQLITARDALHRQATHDGLTGILNRTAIIDTFQQELARAARSEGGVGLLLLDLDHFKAINDTLGHLTGDAVLRETARRLAEEVRMYDLVGRYGGEEFLVVLPESRPEAVLEVGERLRRSLADKPVHTDTHTVEITASFGAHWLPGTADCDAAIRAADDALYAAKHAGRNRVVMAGCDPGKRCTA